MVAKSFIFYIIFLFSYLFFSTHYISYVKAQSTIEPEMCYVDNFETTIEQKVLVINYDPNVVIDGITQSLRSYLRTIDQNRYDGEQGWEDPNIIKNELATTLNELSNNAIHYNIVETITESDWEKLPLIGGKKLTQKGFFDCYSVANKADYCYDLIDIGAISNTYNLCERSNNNEIDEVWLYLPKYGYRDQTFKIDGIPGYESASIAPTKYSDLKIFNEVHVDDSCENVVPLLFNNYNYSSYYSVNWDSLHFLEHRFEFILYYLFGNNVNGWYKDAEGKLQPNVETVNPVISSFTYLTNKYLGYLYPYQNYPNISDYIFNTDVAGCGITHGDPVSTSDYEHNNSGSVESNCYNPSNNIGYDNFGISSLSSIISNVTEYTCNLWGCNFIGWQKFYMKRWPANKGVSEFNTLNNWWQYMAKPELVKANLEQEDACTCPYDYTYNPQDGLCHQFNCNTDPSICTGELAVCSIDTGLCVECNTANDCPSTTNLCIDNYCQVCRGIIDNGICNPCNVVDPQKPIFNNDNGQCESCPTGYIYNGTECVIESCLTDPFICTGITPYCSPVLDTCVSCITDSECGLGELCTNGKCSVCPSDKPVLTIIRDYNDKSQGDAGGWVDKQICSSCDIAGDQDTNNCPISCPTGYSKEYDPYLQLEVCKKDTCGPNSVICTGTTPWCSNGECKACPQDSFFDPNSSTCIYCGEDEFFDGLTCTKASCLNGGLTCFSESEQPFCNDSNGECVECLVDSHCVAGHLCINNICVQCTSLNEYYNPDTNSCVTCGANEEWDSVNNQCIPTNNSCILTDNCIGVIDSNSNCISCEANDINTPYFNQQTGTCEACPSGTTYSNGLCTGNVCENLNCEASGKVCDSELAKCVDCNSDSQCDVTEACVNNHCIKGSYNRPSEETFTPISSTSSIFMSCDVDSTPDPILCITSCPTGEELLTDPETGVKYCKSTTCGANNTFCSGSTPACVDGVCIACPENSNFSTATKTCIYCNKNETWNGTYCETKSCTNGGLTCGSAGQGNICNTDSGRCVECIDSNDCSNGEICYNGKCGLCPASTPNFNIHTGQCESACSNPTATWNGRRCVEPADYDSNGFYIETDNSKIYQSSTGFDITQPSSSNVCNIDTPYYVLYWNPPSSTDLGIKEYYGNSIFDGNTHFFDSSVTSSLCIECQDNVDCSGDSPICRGGTCIKCPIDRPFSVYNNALSQYECLSCPSESPIYNPLNNSCETCPIDTIFNPTTRICENLQQQVGACEPNSDAPYCSNTTNTCAECNVDSDCQTIQSMYYNGDAPYCVNSKCAICPVDLPNFNYYTNECEPACASTTQIWNGRRCIDPSTMSDLYQQNCFESKNGLPTENSKCTIDKPYCVINSFDSPFPPMSTEESTVCYNNTIIDLIVNSNGTFFYNIPTNYYLSDGSVDTNYSFEQGVLCIECTENLDCPIDTPVCVSGSCSACPTATPFFNTETNECEACPVEKPNFVYETKSCEVCPPESNWNDTMQRCEYNNCFISGNKCPAESPICLSDGSCGECLTNVDCPVLAPTCSNNQCTQCLYFDPVTQDCYQPLNTQNIPDNILVWDSNSKTYVAVACANGSLKCNDPSTPVCLADTNTCVECAIDSHCDALNPVCNTTTNTCETCPADKPYFAPVASSQPTVNITNEPTTITQINTNNDFDDISVFNDELEPQYTCISCPDNTFFDGESCIEYNCTNGGEQCENNGLVCDTNTGECVSCTTNTQCNIDLPYCTNGNCTRCSGDKPFFSQETQSCIACQNGLQWYNNFCISPEILSISGSVLFGNDPQSPIPNVEIKLIGFDYRGLPVELVELTDPYGVYNFENILPGYYGIEETQPTLFKDGEEIAGTLGGDISENDKIKGLSIFTESSTNNNFIEYGYQILTSVLYDRDYNQRKSAEDLPIENVEIFLKGTNDLGIYVEQRTYTNKQGQAIFSNVRPGLYELHETQPDGFSDSIDIAASGAYVPANDIISSIFIDNYFDENQTNIFLEGGFKVSGTVFLDNERDKKYDGREYLFDDVKIELRNLNNERLTILDLEIGGVTDTIVEVTDNGYYEFKNIPNGKYLVVEKQPDGYGSTTENSVEVTVFNRNVNNINFGEKGGVIRGHVYLDTNKDSIIDSNETVFDDLEMLITGPNGYKETIRTGDLGDFVFRGLVEGEYTISIPRFNYISVIYISSGEEQLNFLIDLSGYLINNSNTLNRTGWDLRPIYCISLFLVSANYIVHWRK